MIDVVQMVRDGLGRYEWAEVISTYGDLKLRISVFRDAMKFDNMPAMTWKREPIPGDTRVFNGVRVPATAGELQQIAYLLGCMLMTPKVIDLLWLQAQLKFDSIVNSGSPSYTIVATMNINDVHDRIEAAITKAGGDDGTKLIDSVGKYWCLINELKGHPQVQGDYCACNYGWPAKVASGPGITPGVQVYQRPGFAHNKLHWDPSQTIRLMHPFAVLIRADGTEEQVDLRTLASDPSLAPLITHQSTLTYLVQEGIEPLDELGTILLPPTIIEVQEEEESPSRRKRFRQS